MHPGMLASAMETMCRNKKERLKMGLAGRKRVEKYYLHNQMIGNYLKNYEEVITQWQESALS